MYVYSSCMYESCGFMSSNIFHSSVISINYAVLCVRSPLQYPIYFMDLKSNSKHRRCGQCAEISERLSICRLSPIIILKRFINHCVEFNFKTQYRIWGFADVQLTNSLKLGKIQFKWTNFEWFSLIAVFCVFELIFDVHSSSKTVHPEMVTMMFLYEEQNFVVEFQRITLKLNNQRIFR